MVGNTAVQMELALAGRLDLLKAADLDAFLDATLACLRLVQNILEHPHNERYRRLRGSAPVSTCSVWRAGSACTPPLCMCVTVRAFTIKYHAFCCMRECVVHGSHFVRVHSTVRRALLADFSPHAAHAHVTCVTVSSFSPCQILARPGVIDVMEAIGFRFEVGPHWLQVNAFEGYGCVHVWLA